MKEHFTVGYLIGVVIITAIVAGSIVYLVIRPHETSFECTKEFIRDNGDGACDNRIKADEAESNYHQDNQR